MSPFIVAKVTHYSSGEKEVGWCVQSPPESIFIAEDNSLPPVPRPRGRNPRYESETYAEGSAERASRRARQAVRKRLVEHRLDHLVTLTHRANDENRERLSEYRNALPMLQAFVKLVREQIPGWKYVAVPERHKSGVYHWHLAAHGWQKLAVLREAWAKVCGGIGAGNVDVKAPRNNSGRYQWRPNRLAGYLLKYVLKEITERPDEMKGRHRYMSAHGLETWDTTHDAFPIETTIEEIAAWFANLAGQISRIWVSPDGDGIGWAAS